MRRRKAQEPSAETDKTPDWLDKMVDEIYQHIEQGQHPSLSLGLRLTIVLRGTRGSQSSNPG